MPDLNSNPVILQYISGNSFGNLIGMNFRIEEKGKVAYELTVTKELLATPHVVHGGVLAALCDGALGVAALSQVCEEDRIVSTVEMNIKYLKPVFERDCVTAKAEVVSAGKRIVISQVTVFNQKNQLVAIGSGTFNAYPKERAGY